MRVAAAASLAPAFEELGLLFEEETGQRVVFSFGSTGLLAKQLEGGAPFDLFAAANVAFVDAVIAAGACDEQTKAAFAHGRLAIWSRDAARAPNALAQLADPVWRTIAIAQPEHAPYGRAAREALAAAGVLDAVEARLVFGANVRQTLQFAETGNADVALVSLSLVVVAREGEPRGAWALVDDALHAPIEQALVVCDGGAQAEGGAAFARLIGSPRGREVMRRYGFALPGEATPIAR